MSEYTNAVAAQGFDVQYKEAAQKLQQLNSSLGHPRCECHECTQARWNMSFQAQTQGLAGSALQNR